MKTKKQRKKYVHQTVLNEIELCDLDLELQDFIFGLNTDGHEIKDWFKAKKSGNLYWNGENDYANIDVVIKTLQKLKKEGATHVDITPHCDHHGYYFYGSTFREATEEEVQKEIDAKESAKRLVEKTEMQRALETIASNPVLAEKLQKKNDSNKS